MSAVGAHGPNLSRAFVGLAVLLMALPTAMVVLPGPAVASGSGVYPPPAFGDWIISANTVVSNENLDIKGNVIVQSGKSLTVDHDMLTMNNSVVDPLRIEVLPTGTLTVRRSTVQGYDAEYPFYIVVRRDGKLLFDNSTLAGAGVQKTGTKEQTGLAVYSDNATITNSVIRDGWVGLYAENATPTVTGNNFTHNMRGAWFYGSTGAIVTNDVFYGNVVGLFGERSAMTVLGCQFVGNNQMGIGASESTVLVLGSTVTQSEYAAVWASGSIVSMADGTLDGWPYDVYLEKNTTVVGLNMTMALTSIDVEDQKSHLTAYDQIDVRVIWWSDSGPVDGAVVNITGPDGSEVANGTTAPDGFLRGLTVPAFDVFYHGNTIYNPLDLVARSSGLRGNTTADIKGRGQVNITIDDIRPNLNVTLSGSNGYYNKHDVSVQGVLWDNESGPSRVEVSVDGENFTEADGVDLWNLTTVLADGGHNITVRGWDVAGNNRTVALNLTIDTKAPALSIKAPKNGLRTNRTRVWVNGTAEKGANLTLDGKGINNTNGNWGQYKDLVEGPNNITVEARDRAGNIGRAFVVVTRDTMVDPLVIIPVNGSSVNTVNLTIRGTTEPGVFLRATWDVVVGTGNNTTVEHRNATATADAKGAFNLTVRLNEGINNITFLAKDLLNNTKRVNLTYKLDSVPPLLVVTSPKVSPYYTNKNGVNIKGRTEAGARVFLNGQELQTYDLQFTIRVEVFLGPNNFTVSATDLAGNLAKLNLTIIVDKTPPNLTVARPSQSLERTHDAYYTVSGTTEDGATVYINGVAYPVHGGRFEAKRSLALGKNELAITAKDQAGNVRSVQRVIIREKAPQDMTMIYIGYSIPIIVAAIIVGLVLAFMYKTGRLHGFKDYLGRRKEAKEKEADEGAGAKAAPKEDKEGPEEPMTIPGTSEGPSYDDDGPGDKAPEDKVEEIEGKEGE